MMKRIVYVFLICLVSLILWRIGAAQQVAYRSTAKTIEVDGRTRTYHVGIPRQAKGPLPLVFVLHGGGNINKLGSKGRQLERYTQLSAIGAREGFIACYPEGFEGNWNDGRSVSHIKAHSEDIDDVKFLRNVVEAIGREHDLDHSRIFATGISNGAFMSHRLAAEASEVFSAIAPVAGGMPEPIAEHFEPRYPVSLFIIQGESDPLVPIAGGEVGYRFGKKRGKFIPTNESVAKYVKRNGIKGQPNVTLLKDIDPDDGTTTEATRYPPGRNGARVQLYVVKNGGHTWPGRPLYLPERLVGNDSQDFNASEEIWKFFKSCPPRRLEK